MGLSLGACGVCQRVREKLTKKKGRGIVYFGDESLGFSFVGFGISIGSIYFPVELPKGVWFEQTRTWIF